MILKIKKTHPGAIIPQYATKGAACFDLHAAGLTASEQSVPLWGNAICRTGLAFEIPKGHVMLLFSRSGHGFKFNTRLANAVGIIDEDFHQEVMVKLVRDPGMNEPLFMKNGDRIAQAMVIPVDQVEFEVVDEITQNGRGGFGSTGS